MARRTRSRARMPRNSPANMRTGSSKEASDTIYLRKLHRAFAEAVIDIAET